MVLKRGSAGKAVKDLQKRLIAAGYNPGNPDGDYGEETEAAVLAFQMDRPDIDDDGEAGPMTMGALDAALNPPTKPPPAKPVEVVACEAKTWTAFINLIDQITQYPVKYGPGRGLWKAGKFLITYAAGRETLPGDLKIWNNKLGHFFPAFHCTSFTNMMVAWLLRRNELFTHGGNMPSLFDLMEKGPGLHDHKDLKRVYRGYGDESSPIKPDGSGAKRSGNSALGVVDARELYARRESLPTFLVFGQSTRDRTRSTGWNWWHHTGLFVIDHNDKSRMYRIAADGFRGADLRYNAQPMRWVEITEKNIRGLDACVYRVYGVDTLDGTYGDQSKPIADVAFETF